MPKRIHNWDVALAMWATDLLGTPFVWGTTDCASLVRAACVVIYGEELWPMTPGYASQTEALQVFSQVGSVRANLEALGATQHVLTFTQPGDIIIAPAEDGEIFDSVAVAVCDKILIAHEGDPLRTIPVWQAPEQASAFRLPQELFDGE